MTDRSGETAPPASMAVITGPAGEMPAAEREARRAMPSDAPGARGGRAGGAGPMTYDERLAIEDRVQAEWEAAHAGPGFDPEGPTGEQIDDLLRRLAKAKGPESLEAQWLADLAAETPREREGAELGDRVIYAWEADHAGPGFDPDDPTHEQLRDLDHRFLVAFGPAFIASTWLAGLRDATRAGEAWPEADERVHRSWREAHAGPGSDPGQPTDEHLEDLAHRMLAAFGIDRIAAIWMGEDLPDDADGPDGDPAPRDAAPTAPGSGRWAGILGMTPRSIEPAAEAPGDGEGRRRVPAPAEPAPA